MDPFDGFSERTEIMHELSGTDYSVAISGILKNPHFVLLFAALL